jgi:hypothetical protein
MKRYLNLIQDDIKKAKTEKGCSNLFLSFAQRYTVKKASCGSDTSFLAGIRWLALLLFCRWLLCLSLCPFLPVSNNRRLFTKLDTVRKKPIIATIDHVWLTVEFVACMILSPCMIVPITAKDSAVLLTAFSRVTRSLFII